MQQGTKKMSKGALAGMSLGALGIVYGDIGTSPLYAINEIFFGHAHIHRTDATILKLISLVLWTLVAIVAFKYVVWVLRADNDGEGGTFALLALLKKYKGRIIGGLTIFLVFAAGLLFGEGIITPAISVLSAIEGLSIVTPTFTPYIVPITIAVLTGLFAIQSRGTHKIGKLFGPVILVWFATIAVLGARQIVGAPEIFAAFNPMYALQAFAAFPIHQLFIVLGSVVLVITGGEALFADMGHFGKGPIRLSWFSVVMPCLMLNYLGQGAFLLQGKAVLGDNVFYSMVPEALLIPMVVLACLATIIASQALISGAFSLTAQGIALGLLPRLTIKHTHEHHEGQIYIPFINWALYANCIALVVAFGSASRLASAYGFAVSGVMMATTLSMFVIARKLWRWSPVAAVGLFAPILVIDVLFFTANSLKFLQGGFIPLLIGCSLYIVMSTWQWGRKHWSATLESHATQTMADILTQKRKQKFELDRSLLILTMDQPRNKKDTAPALLDLFVKRNNAIPKHIITLTVKQLRKPHVDPSKRYIIHEFENDHKKDSSLISMTAQFGFMEDPDVEQVLQDIADNERLTPNDDMKDWTIYVARERIISHKHKGQHRLFTRLRVGFYALLARNSTPAYEYFGLGEDSRLNAELLPIRITT